MKKKYYLMSLLISTALLGEVNAQNVGIGTSAPSSKLHIVDNSANNTKILVETDNTPNIAAIALINTARAGGISMGIVNNLNTYGDPGETYIYSSVNMQGLNIMNQNNSGNGHIALYAGRNNASTATMFIANNQRVGIATETPTEMLHVEGGARITSLSGVGNRLVQTNTTGVVSNIADGTAGQVLTTNGAGALSWGNGLATAWLLNGNAGTTPGTDFIGTTDNQDFQLRSNGALRLTVESSGELRMQNSTATYLRSGASGGARILGEQGHTPARPALGFFSTNGVDDGGGGNGIYRPSANTMAFATASLERMRLDVSGNLNLGVVSGPGRLNVNLPNTNAGRNTGIYNNYEGGSTAVKYAMYNNLNTTVTGTQYALYNNIASTNTSAKYGIYNNFANINGTKYGVYNYFPNGTATGTIYGTYNYIQNDATATKYGTYNYVAGGNGGLYGSRNNIYPASTNTSTIYGVYGYVSSAGTGIHYGGYFNAYGAGNRAIYGTNSHVSGWAGYFQGNGYFSGNVGIGTNAPTEKLQVNADRVLVQNGSDAMYCSINTFNNYGFELIGSYPGFGASAARAIILGGYNQNNTNGQGFDAANRVQCGGGGSATLPIYATSHITTSSAVYKQNISKLKYGLKEVLQINPVTYQYKFDKTQLYKVGFIAEDISKIVPEIVAHHDENGNAVTADKGKAVGMDYSQMTAVLVNAIKEQQEQMEVLKSELKSAQKEIEALKNK